MAKYLLSNVSKNYLNSVPKFSALILPHPNSFAIVAPRPWRYLMSPNCEQINAGDVPVDQKVKLWERHTPICVRSRPSFVWVRERTGREIVPPPSLVPSCALFFLVPILLASACYAGEAKSQKANKHTKQIKGLLNHLHHPKSYLSWNFLSL